MQTLKTITNFIPLRDPYLGIAVPNPQYEPRTMHAEFRLHLQPARRAYACRHPGGKHSASKPRPHISCTFTYTRVGVGVGMRHNVFIYVSTYNVVWIWLYVYMQFDYLSNFGRVCVNVCSQMCIH